MEIYKKLFEAKKEIGKISKDSTNPFFQSKYFDINQLLEHVEPILQKNGLLLLQPILDNAVTSRIVDIETEGYVESCLDLTDLKDPQKRGSEITYYRRYTLASLLGLQAEDDDANKSSNNKPERKELPWLNKYTDKSHSKVTTEWNRAVATLKSGKNIDYLRNYFKIARNVAEDLEDEVNNL